MINCKGRLYLIAGLVLPFLGIAAYAMQIHFERLNSPWYVPMCAMLGIGLVAASLWQRRTVWRVAALLFVVFLAGAEWSFHVMLMLPAYSGPAMVGKPFPAFTTAKADRSPFSQTDLVGDANSVIVFFRGRW